LEEFEIYKNLVFSVFFLDGGTQNNLLHKVENLHLLQRRHVSFLGNHIGHSVDLLAVEDGWMLLSGR
jgi:hypothetical protein